MLQFWMSVVTDINLISVHCGWNSGDFVSKNIKKKKKKNDFVSCWDDVWFFLSFSTTFCSQRTKSTVWGRCLGVRAATSSYQVTGSIPCKPECPWERQCVCDEQWQWRRLQPSVQQCHRMNEMQPKALGVLLNHPSSTRWRKVLWLFPILPSLAGNKDRVWRSRDPCSKMSLSEAVRRYSQQSRLPFSNVILLLFLLPGNYKNH